MHPNNVYVVINLTGQANNISLFYLIKRLISKSSNCFKSYKKGCDITNGTYVITDDLDY